MKYFNLWAAIAALVMLAGCSPSLIMAPVMLAADAPSKSLGEPVNFDYAKTITPKITTRSEVVAGMGKPALVTQDGDIETWRYEHRVRPGMYDVLTHQSRVNHAGDSTVVTVVFRGDIVVAVAGTDFNQDKGAEVKFSKGETQLIPLYQGGGQMVTIPQAVSAQPPAAGGTTGANQQPTESAAIQAAPPSSPEAQAANVATNPVKKVKAAPKKPAPKPTM
jgi:outer membrane protein assembly factor BamE (lipoprotein component of BamABCDE complex)